MLSQSPVVCPVNHGLTGQNSQALTKPIDTTAVQTLNHMPEYSWMICKLLWANNIRNSSLLIHGVCGFDTVNGHLGEIRPIPAVNQPGISLFCPLFALSLPYGIPPREWIRRGYGLRYPRASCRFRILGEFGDIEGCGYFSRDVKIHRIVEININQKKKSGL